MIHVLDFISLSLAYKAKQVAPKRKATPFGASSQRQRQPNIGHAADAILIVTCKVRSRSLDEACER